MSPEKDYRYDFRFRNDDEKFTVEEKGETCRSDQTWPRVHNVLIDNIIRYIQEHESIRIKGIK